MDTQGANLFYQLFQATYIIIIITATVFRALCSYRKKFLINAHQYRPILANTGTCTTIYQIHVTHYKTWAVPLICPCKPTKIHVMHVTELIIETYSVRYIVQEANVIRVHTWTSLNTFPKLCSTPHVIAKSLLVPFGHSLGYVFEIFYSMCQVLEVIVFSFNPHTPESNQWSEPTQERILQ